MTDIALHQLTEVMEAGPAANKEEDRDRVLTRDEQLRFKASNKVRRDTGTDKSGKGKKAKNTGKSGKGKKKSNANKTKRSKSGAKGMSRKRKMLQNSKTTRGVDFGGGETSEEFPPRQVQTKRPRKAKESTQKLVKDPVKTRAKPKVKVTPNAKPKVDRKAKPKTAPKAKADCKRGKKKVGSEPSLEDQKAHKHYSAQLVDKLVSFANQVDVGMNVRAEAFKVTMRKKLVEMHGYRLNIYWTRQSCGVTNITEGKDLGTFSFNGSSACDAHRIAVAIKCSELMVT